MSIARIQELIEQAGDFYETEPEGFNLLAVGKLGTGKTLLSTTCRKPVYLISFDPGGTRTRGLKPFIADKTIIPDTRFESDDRKAPQAWQTFEKFIPAFKDSGILNHLGTLFFDSLTTMSDALMNEILRLSGRTDGIPQLQDYLRQQFTLTNLIKDAMKFPCDVVFTGHLGYVQDELTGTVESQLFVSGKLIVKIPLLFDEYWVMVAKPVSEGSEYSILTTTDGKNQARTRIGGGIFKQYEETNVKALLHKAGMNAKDKPKLGDLKEGGEDVSEVNSEGT